MCARPSLPAPCATFRTSWPSTVNISQCYKQFSYPTESLWCSDSTKKNASFRLRTNLRLFKPPLSQSGVAYMFNCCHCVTTDALGYTTLAQYRVLGSALGSSSGVLAIGIKSRILFSTFSAVSLLCTTRPAVTCTLVGFLWEQQMLHERGEVDNVFFGCRVT